MLVYAYLSICTLLTFPDQIEPFIPNKRVKQFLKTKLIDLISPNKIFWLN